MNCLVAAGVEVSVVVSKAAHMVISTETELKLSAQARPYGPELISLTRAEPGQLSVYGKEDWMAPMASGSGAPSAMVVCPCGMGAFPPLPVVPVTT